MIYHSQKIICLCRASATARIPRGSLIITNAEGDKIRSDVSRERTGLWFPSEQSLSYLDGTLPGDFGFDPLGLSDPDGKGFTMSPAWLQYAEVIHARWAMLGAAGCITPDILGKLG